MPSPVLISCPVPLITPFADNVVEVFTLRVPLVVRDSVLEVVISAVVCRVPVVKERIHVPN